MTTRNRLLAQLPAPDRAVIGPHLREVNLETGVVLYQPGDIVETVYFPSSAVLSVVTVMEDGRSVEAATIGYESVAGAVGAIGRAPVHARTFCQIPGDGHKLPAAIFRRQVEQNPALLTLLHRFIQRDMAQSEQSVACNALHLVEQRAARWLLLSQDRVNEPVIALTQEYLAVMLGVQRTTVTAVAQQMRTAGLIDYSRGRIRILDRAGLLKITCECYAEGGAVDD